MSPSKQDHIPKYRRQKRPNSVDQAFVELNGRRHYLGPYDSPQSKQAYHRQLAEWSANGQQPTVSRDEITVSEIAARFVLYASDYYTFIG